MGFTRFDGIPRLYDRLAGDRSLVLAEFPFYSGASVSLNGPYVLANTRYFRPLMNGYSSFHPESFEARGRALGIFRARRRWRSCRVAKVTHVTVHANDFSRRYGDASAPGGRHRLRDLQLVAEEDGIRLYRLK